MEEEDNEFIIQKATVDPSMIELQREVTDFITSAILIFEKDFYQIIKEHNPSQLETILSTNTATIIRMIVETVNSFYNRIYSDIQNSVSTPLTAMVQSMCSYVTYGPHILLDKLIRLTVEIHGNFNREAIVVEPDMATFEMSVLEQINAKLISIKLIPYMATAPDDDKPFVIVEKGKNAFNLTLIR